MKPSAPAPARKTIRRILGRIDLACIIALFGSPAAQATTYNWIGGSAGGDFQTPANWIENAWTQWDDYHFGSAVTSGTVNYGGFFGTGSLSLDSGLTQDITIGGSQPIVMRSAFSNSGLALISIDTNSKNLTINNQYWISDTATWSVGANRTLTINGTVIDWAGQPIGSIIKQGAGTTVLTGANTYTGTTTINGGALRIQNNTALGVGGFNGGTMTFVNDGASLEIDGSLTIDEHMHLHGTGFGGNGAISVLSGNTTLTTNIALFGTATQAATIQVATGASLTQTATFYDGGGTLGLTKTGGGTLTLTAANSFTGTTTVNGGTLELTLGNTAVGTLNTGSSITVNSGGTLLANSFNALGYTSHSGDALQINEGGTLTVGAGKVVSMPYNLNVVGGSLTSVDGGDPSLGTYYFGGGTQTFTSSGSGTASVISAQNVNLAGPNVAFNVTAGSGAVDLSVTGNLIGTGSLLKTGNGVMILNGANTYSGGTTISGGTLQVGNGGATGSTGSGPVVNNATLVLNNTSGLNVDSTNAITGTGALIIKAGILFVNYNAGGSVSNGTITVDGTSSSNSSSFLIWAPGPVTLANNFVLNSMGPAQARGAINQDGGAGLVTLNGSITLAGDSRIGVGGGSWNSMVANGQITGPGKLFVYERHDATPSSTELRLTNNTNNYSGGTEIEQGRLSITQAGALGSGPVTITGANSQLLIDEVSGTIANNFTLGGGGNPTSTNYGYGNATMVFHNDGQSATLSGVVTLAGDAKIRGYSSGGTTIFSNPIGGTGNLTFEAGGATTGHTQTWVLQGGTSTFNGTTLVRSDGYANAVLRAAGGSLTGALTLESSSAVGGNIAMLDLNGTNFSVGGLNSNIGGGSLGNFVSNLGGSPGTLTINGGGNYNGVIGVNTSTGTTGIAAGSNDIALVKSGTGTQTLSGANTYTGATLISGGKLIVNGDQTSANGLTTVAAGTIANNPVATLGGIGTIGGSVGLAAQTGSDKNGGVLSPTAAAAGTALKVKGTTTFGSGSIFGWNMAAADPAVDPGNNTANSGFYSQLAGTGAITSSSGDAVFSIVLGSGNAFTDNFWSSNKTWNNVFSGNGATTDLASIFSSFSGNGVSASGDVAQGSFSFSGHNTLNYTFTAVPEPTSALAGLLLAAGLLRRRRR